MSYNIIDTNRHIYIYVYIYITKVKLPTGKRMWAIHSSLSRSSRTPSKAADKLEELVTSPTKMPSLSSLAGLRSIESKGNPW